MRAPTVDDVIACTAAYYGVPLANMRRTWQRKTTMRARAVAMFVARRVCGASLPELGAAFGCHHTTVLHWLDKIEAEWHDNPVTFAAVQCLERAVADAAREALPIVLLGAFA